MAAILPYLQRTSIAYFSMEIALRPEIHSYSGGLGILAGDTARAATTGEVQDLRREARALKECVADLTLENRLLKKSMVADGGNDE